MLIGLFINYAIASAELEEFGSYFSLLIRLAAIGVVSTRIMLVHYNTAQHKTTKGFHSSNSLIERGEGMQCLPCLFFLLGRQRTMQLLVL